tara:strand:+ start:3069 stop:3908 length:840 start_codon:yes stop_codon:yes gene_type:complete
MLITLKYSLVKFLEKVPFLQMFIYNNLILFKFLLPQDKDYLGLKILFDKNEKRTFVDIGGNIGLSSASFREMGFKNNQILIFEPDQYLIKNYLNKLKTYYKKLKIFPFGLSDKNEFKILYQAKYKKLSIHLNNSFDKKYILNKIKNNYPDKFKLFKYKMKKFKCKKFDSIHYKKDICFIKIDVEGLDHLVIKGMNNFLKKNKPIFLIEFNQSNFSVIWSKLKKNYNCYSYDIDKNCFKNFSSLKIKKLIIGHIFDKKYDKNSVNLFLIPKSFRIKQSII